MKANSTALPYVNYHLFYPLHVVSSFKLGDGEENVQFDGYVVRLVQKIRQIDNNLEYALTVQ